MARQVTHVFDSPLEGSSVEFVWDDVTMTCSGGNASNASITANPQARAERQARGQSGAPLPLFIILTLRGDATPKLISVPPGHSGGFTFPTPTTVTPTNPRPGVNGIDLGIDLYRFSHIPTFSSAVGFQLLPLGTAL